MDNYNTRQSMYCKNHSNCTKNNQNNNSAAFQSGDSCPYQGIDRMPLAMAYVPWQQWKNLYDPAKGLRVGTIFQELDLPFCERSCFNS